MDSLSEASIAGRGGMDAAVHDIEAGGALLVEANEAQQVYTTASASADKSLGDAAKAASARTAGSSVGVGASFAANFIDARVIARIGTETVVPGADGAADTVEASANRNISAASLAVKATFRDDVDTVAVAGSDPIARRDKAFRAARTLGRDNPMDAVNESNEGTNTKNISADAAVAVAIVNNEVKAELLSGGRLTTTASADTLDTAILAGVDAAGADVFEKANVLLQALYSGDSYTGVSAFAAGRRAAVGAAVGYSQVESDIRAALASDTEAGGSVRVYAATNVTDEMNALATSVGADLDRLLEKFREGLNYVGFGAAETSTLTDTIAGAVNKAGAIKLQDKFTQSGAAQQARFEKSVPFSSNLLRVFNVDFSQSTGAANGASSAASGAAAESGAGATQFTTPTSSINVAAAVGISLTEHRTVAEILCSVTAKGDVQSTAENNVNFRTRASGATVTTAPTGANTAAAAVAVTVNRNSAESRVADGALLDAGGDVSITAHSSQNMTGNYPAYMSAQAIAASIATGLKGTLGLAGAVAVLAAYADTIAQLGDGVTIRAAGDVLVQANDLSKLAIRALGANIGKQKVGVGAAAAILYAESHIKALAGDGLTVEARSLTVEAERALVDESRYQFPFDWDDLLTFETGATGADKGLFHITPPESLADLDSEWIKDIKIELGLGTESILDLLDMINYLATVNYYVEAVSGSINTAPGGTAAANVAGTIAALFAANQVLAAIGDNARLTLGENDGGESLAVRAESGANTRVIAGSASIGTAKAGVGAVVSIASLSDEASASVGDNAVIDAAGDVTVRAAAAGEVWDVSVADATAVGASSTLAIGGGVNVVLSGTAALASVGDGAQVAADGAFAIDADNDLQAVIIAASVGFATGSTTAAAGGTVSYAEFTGRTGARLGDSAAVEAAGISLTADSSEKVILVLASASGAPESTANIAATVSTFLNRSETVARAGAGVSLTATAGDILVHAFDESTAVAALLSLSAGGSSTAAIGATVLTHIFEQQALASVGVSEKAGVADAATLRAARGSILVEADVENLSAAAGAALTASGQSKLNFAGTVVTSIYRSEAAARMGDHTDAAAYDSIGVVADGESLAVVGAGAVTVTGSAQASIGASVGTLLVENAVEATVGKNGSLTAYALSDAVNAGIQTANRAERRRGVVIHAFSSERLYLAAVGGSVAGSGVATGTGVVDTLIVRSRVIAQVGENTAVSAGVSAAEGTDADGDGSADDSDGEGEIAVEADGETLAVNFGGALSASGGSTAALGATVVTISFEKQVSAILDGGSARVHAEKDVTVSANSSDTLYLLSATFGVTGGTAGVAIGGNVLLFGDLVQAHLGGAVSAGGDVTVAADSVVRLYSVGLSAAGGGTAGVGGVAIVTYFTGTTEALLLSGSAVDASGALAILANSREFITADGAGISGGGSAGVSGTVDVIVTELVTRAEVEDNAGGGKPAIEAASIEIRANDDYQLIGVAASAAFAGSAGVGVTAIVTVAKNTVSAGIGDNYAVRTSLADVLIDALSRRDVRTYAGTVSGGGSAGVGAVIMAVVVGGKLDQDSADALQAYFNADALINGANGQQGMKDSAPSAAAGVYEGLGERLGEDVSGSGNRYSGISVGSEDGGYYDGNDQYLSDDFNKEYTVDTSDPQSTDPGQPGVELTIGALEGDGSDRGEAAAILDGFTRPASTDATSAFIGTNTTVESAGDITVAAADVLNASLVTASFSGGGAAGVGVGMAVAILNSNVIACTEAGSVLSAAGDITVSAYAGSPALTGGELSEQDRAANEFLNDEENGDFEISDLTIHAISVSGGFGGTAGVGVAVAVVTLGTNAIATVGGSVEQAGTLTIAAQSEYEHIAAATLALGGGFVGVSASAAAVTYEGTTRASIEGGGSIVDADAVALETRADGSVSVAAAGIAGGAVAVNAGVAVALNRSLVETFIAQGVTVGRVNKAAAPDISLLSHVDSSARAFTVGVTGGAVAVGASVAVVILEPTVRTYIGAAPGTPAATRRQRAASPRAASPSKTRSRPRPRASRPGSPAGRSPSRRRCCSCSTGRTRTPASAAWT